MPRYQGSAIPPHETQPSIGVLLVNLGTPSAPTPKAVRRYLAEFLADPRIVELPRVLWRIILHGIILRLRPRRSAKLYQKIWLNGEGSPLQVHTARLARGLQQALQSETSQGANPPVHVTYAMRYGAPAMTQALNTLSAQAVRHLLVLPLFPQYSATTTASVFDALSKHLQQQRWLPELHVMSGYHDHPAYIQALAATLTQHWQAHPRAEKLLFSFHGIPKRNHLRGDPYYCLCRKTARLVAQCLGLPDTRWEVVFQSRFGAQPWLQPYCDETLTQFARQGVRSVDVVCPGFAVDCLETLEEINITSRHLFLQAGGERFTYIPALNAGTQHVACLSAVMADVLKAWQNNPAIATGYRHTDKAVF